MSAGFFVVCSTYTPFYTKFSILVLNLSQNLIYAKSVRIQRNIKKVIRFQKNIKNRLDNSDIIIIIIIVEQINLTAGWTSRKGDKMKEIPYDEFDPEVVELCRIMNSLPGVHTTESCCGHGCRLFHIFFKIDKGEDRGLFLLGRVTDKRYWEYGYKWDIKVFIADWDPEDENRLPLGYLLESRDIGSESYDQALDLVENIKEHLQHENFLKLYNLDFSEKRNG